MENDAGNSIFPNTANSSKRQDQQPREPRDVDTTQGGADVINSGSVPSGLGDRVNPSAPSTGTEGWGTGVGEENIAMTNIAANNPPASGSRLTPEPGQPKDIRHDDLRKQADKKAS